MKQRISSLIIAASLVLSLSACNQNTNHASAEAISTLELADVSSSPAKDIASTQAVERKIIREGTIRFETSNATETRKNILATVAQHKGYISQDNSDTYGGRTVHTLTIRIPAENFDTLLSTVSNQASNIEAKEIKALDVTEEFIDVESRIKTKKELEQRYKELLNKANKIDEILSIEKEIESLRSDIESYEGRLNYLKSSISFSTLTITFHEKGESTTSIGFEFSSAFAEGWHNLVSFTLGLFYIWPFILISLGIFFFIRRRIKRRKQKNSQL